MSGLVAQASLPGTVSSQESILPDSTCFEVVVVIQLYLRVIESLELEGTFKGQLVQLPCSEQGYPELDQAAQGLIPPPL